MAIVRAEPFPSLAPGRQCLNWSKDCTLAVTLENGIYMVRFGLTALQKDFSAAMFTMKNSDQVTLPMNIIPLEEKVREYDIRVPRPEYQADLIKQASGEFIEMMWNRTLSPSILSGFSGQTFLQCKLSPCGAETYNRSVLCSLSVDHRTSIYSRGEDREKWKKIVDLCQLMYEKLDSEKFQSVPERTPSDNKKHKENKKFYLAKDRSDAMGIIAIDWSHVFEDEGKDNKFALVVGVARSGHLAVWKVAFPVINSSSCKLVDFFTIAADHPSSVKWCQVDGSLGCVVIGYTSGRVRSIAFHQDNIRGKLVEGKVIDLWQDEDQIPVVAFAWSKENSILFAAKGPYVLAYKLQVKRNTLEVVNVSLQHTVIGTGSFHVHCLDYRHPYLYVEHQDGAFELTVDTTAGLKLDVREMEFEKLEGNWRYEGMVVSPNRVLIALCNSPSKRYCHLTVRNPTRLVLLNLRTIDEVCELISKMEYHSLDTIADMLLFVKQYSLKERKLPEHLKNFFLKDDANKSVSSSLLWLKIVSYLYQLERSVIILEKYDENEINNKIKKMEELILAKHCIESLTNLAVVSNMNDLSNNEKKSAMVMCRWLSLKTDLLNEESLSAIKNVQSQIASSCEDPSSFKEQCPICKKTLLVTNPEKDTCEKKHSFTRCSQTMLQITSVKSRKCLNCHRYARLLEGNTSEFGWLDHPSRLQCTFCDNLVI